MKEKIKSVAVTYPEDMDELRKQYSKLLAKVIMKTVSIYQINELIYIERSL